ncbi:MAG: nucleoside triphosphate pyrophosphohydrolase [Desulfobacterales bacterium]
MRLVESLRGPGGCPWDRKQTPKSMSIYLIEEVYELIDSMKSRSPEEICEELGDVLFHIIFIAGMYNDLEYFDIQSAARRVTEKMIRRHPHVFGDKTIETVKDVKEQWRKIKKKESEPSPERSILDSVPVKLPALIRAYRISERAAGAGFDWDDITGVMTKVKEELAEFHSAHLKGEKDKASVEFGDILFTLVNVARFAGFHPETALEDSTDKFEKRFRYMEKTLSKRGKHLEEVPREELEILWEKAKKMEIG